MPKEQRWAATVGIQLAIAILLFFVDHALGYAALTISAIWWARRVPPLPWRLVIEAGIVLVFPLAGPRPFAGLFSIAFALFLAPQGGRGRPLPLPPPPAGTFLPSFLPPHGTTPLVLPVA